MGRNCLREVAGSNPERIVAVYTSLDIEENAFLRGLSNISAPIKRMSKKALDKLTGSASNQSVAALVREKKPPVLKEFFALQGDSSLAVMLDSIFDPQNFGAILRACECFGVDLVIYSKNRGCGISPVVSKTSSGASELVQIYPASNLDNILKIFQDAGYTVIASALCSGSRSLADFKFSPKTLLIFGSEGKGIRPLLLKRADFIVQIPMSGRIDSLNVAQAAAVFLSYYSMRS